MNLSAMEGGIPTTTYSNVSMNVKAGFTHPNTKSDNRYF